MDQSDSFYNQGLDNPPSSTIDSVEKYFAKDINYRKPYEQQLRITTTMTAPTPPFSPPSIASSQSKTLCICLIICVY
jgi:hypothetical protein